VNFLLSCIPFILDHPVFQSFCAFFFIQNHKNHCPTENNRPLFTVDDLSQPPFADRVSNREKGERKRNANTFLLRAVDCAFMPVFSCFVRFLVLHQFVVILENIDGSL
jgi:hypothetical protein